MARAVMTPLTRSERMRPVALDGRSMRAVASQIIKPNDRLTSFERLEIYNRQYCFACFPRSLRIFPGCAPCWEAAGSMRWLKRI